MIELLSLGELAKRLGLAAGTLNAAMRRYGAEFPIVQRGSHGRRYQFDAEAVAAFLRAKRAEAAAALERARADREAEVAAVPLPFAPATAAPPGAPGLRDEAEAWRLRRMQRAEAERTGALVPAAEVGDALAAGFNRLSRDLRALLRQVGRERGWPESYLAEVELRLADQQRATVAAVRLELAAGAAGAGVVADERERRSA